MPALAGKKALVKVPGTAIAFTAEATATGDAKSYQIVNTAKRIWSPTATISVLIGGVAAGEAYTLNRLTGTVIFAVTNFARAAVTVTGSYLPLSTVAEAKDYSWQIAGQNVPDNAFGDEWVTRVNAGFDVTGSLGRWWIDTYFSAALLADTPLVFQFFTDATTVDFTCWARLSRRSVQSALRGLSEEMLDFEGTTDNDNHGAVLAGVIDPASVVDEITYLRATITGADAGLLAVYSARSGITQAAGTASAWDDLRGGGFGPQLTPNGTGLSVDGTDANSWYLRSNGGRKMHSAATALFTLSSAKAVVIVGTMSSTTSGSNFPANLSTSDALATSLLGFGESENSNDYHVHGFYNPGSSKIYSLRQKSAKLRLFVVGANSATGTIATPPLPAITGAISAQSGNTLLQLGYSVAADVDEKFRAVLVLNHVPSTLELNALQTWVKNYHNIGVTGAPNLVVYEGDSLPYGTGCTKLGVKDFPTVLGEKAFYAGYDDANVGVPGSYITGNGTAALNLTNATRAAALDLIFSASPSTKKILVVWAGTNDITLGGHTGTTAHSDLSTYCLARKAAIPGLKIIVLPMIPRLYSAYGGVQPSQAQSDTYRGDLNTAMAAGYTSYADAYVNLLADGAFNANADYLDTTYYDADGVHLNDTGYQRVADLVDPVLQLV